MSHNSHPKRQIIRRVVSFATKADPAASIYSDKLLIDKQLRKSISHRHLKNIKEKIPE